MNQPSIDPIIFDLYDEYCHSSMSRREFLELSAKVGASGYLMAMTLLPDYAKAQTISFTDSRIKARYLTYDSPGGNSGKMRGYMVEPTGKGPFPSVLVVHENRGLNPYIEDVARRVATEGFLALAPDALYPLGGYPGNDDDGKILQQKLDREKIFVDFKNSAKLLEAHELSNGKMGVTGFCFGGAVSNYLAADLGSKVKVAVPFYGSAAQLKDVPKIKAHLQLHYAEDDPRVNDMQSDYKKALVQHVLALKCSPIQIQNMDFTIIPLPATMRELPNWLGNEPSVPSIST